MKDVTGKMIYDKRRSGGVERQWCHQNYLDDYNGHYNSTSYIVQRVILSSEDFTVQDSIPQNPLSRYLY